MTILIFIIVLGVLILFHELGHFIVAQLVGIKVEEFAFGFPPRLLSFKRRGTHYSINLIPLGGYVKLLGEQGESTSHKAFVNKSVTQRLLVIVAGVVMNVILAIILLTIGYRLGMTPLQLNPTALGGQQSAYILIAGTIDKSPAQIAGLAPGDQITSVNNQIITSVTVLQDLTKQAAGKAIDITIKRNRQDIKYTLTLGKGDVPLGVELVEATKVKLGFKAALVAATKETWLGIEAIAMFVLNLFKNIFVISKVSESVSGPVGIYSLTAQATKLGLTFVLQLTALLSLNLAVLNIVPFPALDGGRALFIALEGIFRRKLVRENVENIIHTIGFVILIALILAITIRDIIRLH